MLPQQLKQELKDNLARGIVRIMITTDHDNPADSSTDYVYTLNKNCDHFCIPSDITPPEETEETIVAWNILKNAFELLDLQQIGVCKFYTDREEFLVENGMGTKHTYNHQKSVDNVKWMLHEIECCCNDSRVSIDRDSLMRIMCDPGTDSHYNERCWEALKTFKFRAPNIHKLCTCHDDEALFNEVKCGYMDCIRDCRDEAFVELDQLEQETRDGGGTEEDLRDVETIKQMFRNIPQEINLDSAQTIHELIEIWPSLLLPSRMTTTLSTTLLNGDVQRSLYEKNMQDDSEDDVVERVDSITNSTITELVDAITDVDELKVLYEQLTSGGCIILEDMTDDQKTDVEMWRNNPVVCRADVEAVLKRLEEIKKQAN